MSTAYSRITLVSDTRRVDLALPSTVPMSTLIPQVLRLCAPAQQPKEPASWSLLPTGGRPLRLDQSLDDAGVADGDLLELVDLPSETRPAYVADARDAVEDAVDEVGPHWGTRASIGCALATLLVSLCAMLLLPASWSTRQLGSLAGAALAAAILAVAGWFAARRRYRLLPEALLAAAASWGAAAGWLAAGWPHWPPAARYAGAAVGLAVSVAIARVLTSRATGHVGAAVPLFLAGVGVGVTAGWSADPITAVRLASLLVPLAIGVVPRLSLAVGGLAVADYRIRHAELVDHDQLGRLVERSSALITGGLAGLAMVAVASAAVLSRSGGGWDRWLALGLGVAMLLRSRLFSQLRHVIALRTAGLAALVCLLVEWALGEPDAARWLVAMVAVAGVLVAAVTAIPLSEITRTRVRQLLNWAEIPTIGCLVLVTAAAAGVFDRVATIAGIG
ncbi:type VII secretion integral membrane protein EccD [Actinocatenispora thailandica]|uniref:Type VII secretion integral membrane protein EccD n=1 Tax=Actinocatenispora thailandica TaxID=227318 RepID=A0A7R7HY93_9ACTN|nr:type VII secretion integral membrane protein EccD [Actinocatenispora thailandica]BCJ37072.1 type VII secretion integral membrane protein EccD [Actinocatenispora thailandica]